MVGGTSSVRIHLANAGDPNCRRIRKHGVEISLTHETSIARTDGGGMGSMIRLGSSTSLQRFRRHPSQGSSHRVHADSRTLQGNDAED